MRVDLVNNMIRDIQPVLQRISVDYEREKFQNVLDKTPSKFKNINIMFLLLLDCMVGKLNVMFEYIMQHTIYCFQVKLISKLLFSDALSKTTSWIQSAIEELLSASVATEKSYDPEKRRGAMPGPFQILSAAFLHILMWDFSNSPVPEVV